MLQSRKLKSLSAAAAANRRIFMAKKIKIRAKAKDDLVTVKSLMNHAMETGLRKDKKTGKKIPAPFTQEVVA